MPEMINLSAEPRSRAGKGPARATRRAGRVPAIVYGDNKEPVPISLEPRELARVLARPGFFNHIVEISVEGATHRTLPREVQYHPVTDAPLHIDFQRVGADRRSPSRCRSSLSIRNSRRGCAAAASSMSCAMRSKWSARWTASRSGSLPT